MSQPPYTDSFRPEFAGLAEAMLRDRQIAYPKLVDESALDAATAKRRLYVLRAIAEIWRCATDGLMPRPSHIRVTRDKLLEELATSIDTAERRLRHRPDDWLRQGQLAALVAMRWWHAQYPACASYAVIMVLNLRYDGLQAMLEADRTAEKLASKAAA